MSKVESLDELLQRLAYKLRHLDKTDNSIQRISHGASDTLPGIIVDKFGPLIVISVYPLQNNSGFAHIANFLCQALPKHNWILRARVDDRLDNRTNELLQLQNAKWKFELSEGLTTDSKFLAQENGLNFEIRTNPKDDFGIYTDAAKARAWIKENANGLRVLNLFSYTCAFAVAACAGGATDVCNVDPNKEYLTWGKYNAKLNGFDFRVVPDTADAYLKRLCKRNSLGQHNPFDLIVIDPPAFGVGRGSNRLLRTLWPQMAAQVTQLQPSKVLALFNDKWFRASTNLQKFLEEHFAGYQIHWLSNENSSKQSSKLFCDPYYQQPAIAVLQK